MPALIVPPDKFLPTIEVRSAKSNVRSPLGLFINTLSAEPVKLFIVILVTFNSSIEAVLIDIVSEIFILPNEAVPAK